jgi:hypothetical protein
VDSVFQELTLGSQRRFADVRRKVQFFSTFAGGVIEALRESGYRLSNIEKEFSYRSIARQQSLQANSRNITTASGGNNLELYFEQRDNDQCRVLIVPYRTDLPYLSKGRYTAQLGLELSRYSSDPNVLRQAMNVNSSGQVGAFFGGRRLPKLYLDSPPTLRQPGSMTFELQGARLVVAMNIMTDLVKYRISDFDLDIEAIKRDLEAYFYGLEKYLSLLLQNFGSDIVVTESDIDSLDPPAMREAQPLEGDSTADLDEKPSPASQTVNLRALADNVPAAPARPGSRTVPLSGMPSEVNPGSQTMPLSTQQLPPDLTSE